MKGANLGILQVACFYSCHPVYIFEYIRKIHRGRFTAEDTPPKFTAKYTASEKLTALKTHRGRLTAEDSPHYLFKKVSTIQLCTYRYIVVISDTCVN